MWSGTAVATTAVLTIRSAMAEEPGKPINEAAARALAEAERRRAEYRRREAELAATREHAGRGGPDPVRYGDWENKGLTSDF